MSPTQPASQPASGEADREQRVDEGEEASYGEPQLQSQPLSTALSRKRVSQDHFEMGLDTHLNQHHTEVHLHSLLPLATKPT